MEKDHWHKHKDRKKQIERIAYISLLFMLIMLAGFYLFTTYK